MPPDYDTDDESSCIYEELPGRWIKKNIVKIQISIWVYMFACIVSVMEKSICHITGNYKMNNSRLDTFLKIFIVNLARMKFSCYNNQYDVWVFLITHLNIFFFIIVNNVYAQGKDIISFYVYFPSY